MYPDHGLFYNLSFQGSDDCCSDDETDDDGDSGGDLDGFIVNDNIFRRFICSVNQAIGRIWRT